MLSAVGVFCESDCGLGWRPSRPHSCFGNSKPPELTKRCCLTQLGEGFSPSSPRFSACKEGAGALQRVMLGCGSCALCVCWSLKPPLVSLVWATAKMLWLGRRSGRVSEFVGVAMSFYSNKVVIASGNFLLGHWWKLTPNTVWSMLYIK